MNAWNAEGKSFGKWKVRRVCTLGWEVFSPSTVVRLQLPSAIANTVNGESSRELKEIKQLWSGGGGKTYPQVMQGLAEKES